MKGPAWKTCLRMVIWSGLKSRVPFAILGFLRAVVASMRALSCASSGLSSFWDGSRAFHTACMREWQ